MDLPPTVSYRPPDRDYPRAALPRRPMYRGDRVACFLMGVAIGLTLGLIICTLFL